MLKSLLFLFSLVALYLGAKTLIFYALFSLVGITLETKVLVGLVLFFEVITHAAKKKE